MERSKLSKTFLETSGTIHGDKRMTENSDLTKKSFAINVGLPELRNTNKPFHKLPKIPVPELTLTTSNAFQDTPSISRSSKTARKYDRLQEAASKNPKATSVVEGGAEDTALCEVNIQTSSGIAKESESNIPAISSGRSTAVSSLDISPNVLISKTPVYGGNLSDWVTQMENEVMNLKNKLDSKSDESNKNIDKLTNQLSHFKSYKNFVISKIQLILRSIGKTQNLKAVTEWRAERLLPVIDNSSNSEVDYHMRNERKEKLKQELLIRRFKHLVSELSYILMKTEEFDKQLEGGLSPAFPVSWYHSGNTENGYFPGDSTLIALELNGEKQACADMEYPRSPSNFALEEDTTNMNSQSLEEMLLTDEEFAYSDASLEMPKLLINERNKMEKRWESDVAEMNLLKQNLNQKNDECSSLKTKCEMLETELQSVKDQNVELANRYAELESECMEHVLFFCELQKNHNIFSETMPPFQKYEINSDMLNLGSLALNKLKSSTVSEKDK